MGVHSLVPCVTTGRARIDVRLDSKAEAEELSNGRAYVKTVEGHCDEQVLFHTLHKIS